MVLLLKTAQILLTLPTLVIIPIISMNLLTKVRQVEFVSIPVTHRNCCKRCTVWLTWPLIAELLTRQQPASITEVKSSLIYECFISF